MQTFGPIWKIILAVCVILLPHLGSSNAQILRELVDKSRGTETNEQSTLPASMAEIDARMLKLAAQIRAVRAAQTNPPPREATPEEQSEHERLCQQWVVALDSQARSMRRLKEIRQWNDVRASEMRNWGPSRSTQPFTVIDRHREEIAAQQLKVESYRIILSIATAGISRVSPLLEAARRSLRLAQDEIDILSAADPRRSWLLRLAQTRVQAYESLIEASEVERLVALEGLAGQRDYISFLTRKLQAAEETTIFTQQDLDEGLARLRELKTGFQSELDAAIAADADFQRAVAAARENLAQAQNDSAPPARLDDLRALLDAARARAETSDFKVDLLRSLIFLSDYGQTLWQDRFWAAGDRSLSELRNKRLFHQQSLGSLSPWKEYVLQNHSAAASQALSQSVRASEANQSATERAQAKEVQAALEERAVLYQRALAGLVLVEKHGQWVIDAIAAKESRLSFTGALQFAADSAASLVRRIWNTELYVAEDSVVSDGRKISIARSITVGKVIIALAIFIVGLLVARSGNSLARRSALRWFKSEDRTASLFAQAVGTVLALIGLFVAMAAVRIPWTVFAFVGGALAIGVGFGAQTLINNFISGLILLFERSIRVGDIVEVDEQRGKIARIGIRNSLIQRGDGVEILVPNSRFLENNVVNWTLTDTLVRYSVSVGVACDSPTRKVSDLIAQVANDHEHVLKTPPPEVLFDEFGDNALRFTLKFWMRLSANVDGGFVRSELRHRLNDLFERSGIVIAFPQRDIHLESKGPLEIKLINSESA